MRSCHEVVPSGRVVRSCSAVVTRGRDLPSLTVFAVYCIIFCCTPTRVYTCRIP